MRLQRPLIIAVVVGMGMGSALTLISERWLATKADLQRNEKRQRMEPPATPSDITTDLLIEGEPTLGRDDAPVTILEFSDFECSYCKRFHDEVFKKLRRSYIEPGLVRFVHKDLPLPFHKQAIPAAAAARCAMAQQSYWQVYSELFKKQQCLGCKGVLEIAGSVVADKKALETCLVSPKIFTVIEANRSEASLLNIRATPTFVIGPTQAAHRHRGRVIEGAMPWPAFQQALDAALKRAGQQSTRENTSDTTTMLPLP